MPGMRTLQRVLVWGHIVENPMSVGLLTFPERRDFHDLLGQRPLSVFMVLGCDQLVLTP